MTTKSTKMGEENKVSKVIYPELSYKINGVLFDVFKTLGPGYREKHIQRAVAVALGAESVNFQEQVMAPIEFKGQTIGRYFLDFVIEDKIVLELKVAEHFFKKDFDQVKDYLSKTGLKLGLLARFGQKGVIIKRVLNPKLLL